MHMDCISNKYFDDHRGNWPAMDPPSLIGAYSKSGDSLTEILSSISIVYSISLFALNFFGNLHNRLMASDQHGMVKLLGIVVLGLVSTALVPIIGLVETAIRSIPALGIYCYQRFLSDETDKGEDGGFSHLFVMGAYSGAVCILEGIRSGYFMLTAETPYLAYDRVTDWFPDED